MSDDKDKHADEREGAERAEQVAGEVAHSSSGALSKLGDADVELSQGHDQADEVEGRALNRRQAVTQEILGNEAARRNAAAPPPDAPRLSKHALKRQRKQQREAAIRARDAIVSVHPGLPYDPKVALYICDRVADGMPLPEVAELQGMPSYPTIRRWLMVHDDFRQAMRDAELMWAQRAQWDALAIADDTSKDLIERETKNGRVVLAWDHEAINRSRLRVETRRWLMSKLNPDRFGDNFNVNHGGSIRATLVIEG